MAEIVIEKGVPIYDNRSKNGRAALYPWDEMEVGDSFIYPKHPEGLIASSKATRRYAPKRFLARKAEGGTTRIWRIA